LQLDPAELVPRVTMGKQSDDLQLNEQTFSKAINIAKERAKDLLK
jgi:hypothetical protein